MNKNKFEIGDLVVERNSKYDEGFCVCRIIDLDYNEEFEFDFTGMNTYLYMTEVICLRGETYGLELGDVIFFEESEIITIEDYLNEEPLTIQDYIAWKQNY